jgi:hypothetical protein
MVAAGGVFPRPLTLHGAGEKEAMVEQESS